jgi:hypothetical protein
MSRHLFLFFVSVSFLVAAAWFYGGVRPGKIKQLANSEYKADIASLHDDVRLAREVSGILRAELWTLWADTRADALMLRADARYQARQLARPFVTNQQF